MAKTFGKTEKKIEEIIKEAKTFQFQGENYSLKKIGKPSPNGEKGEPKTDIYCLAEKSDGIEKEFKISIKQTNADFLENKISLERANEIFGKDAQLIIATNIEKIKKEFQGEFIFIEKKGKTEKGAITIGWKFELLNRISGKKSGKIELNETQKIDVYAGTNISEAKKNSKVNGEIIANSGIANYMLEVDSDTELTVNQIFERLEPIDKYVKNKQIYFACKAINFRTSKIKIKNKPWDGNRPLAVYLEWVIENEKIKGTLIFNNPLAKKADEIGFTIKEILEQIGIESDNFEEIKEYILDKNIISK